MLRHVIGRIRARWPAVSLWCAVTAITPGPRPWHGASASASATSSAGLAGNSVLLRRVGDLAEDAALGQIDGERSVPPRRLALRRGEEVRKPSAASSPASRPAPRGPTAASSSPISPACPRRSRPKGLLRQGTGRKPDQGQPGIRLRSYLLHQGDGQPVPSVDPHRCLLADAGLAWRPGTPWREGRFSTPSASRLIKVAGRVTEMVTRINIALPSAYPTQSGFATLAGRIATLPVILNDGAGCPSTNPSVYLNPNHPRRRRHGKSRHQCRRQIAIPGASRMIRARCEKLAWGWGVRTGRPVAKIDLTAAVAGYLEGYTQRRKYGAGLGVAGADRVGAPRVEQPGGGGARAGDAVNRRQAARRRFIERGLDGLRDEPRPGVPRKIDDAVVESVIVRTLESQPPAATHWSTRSMARHSGIRPSSIGRGIWHAFGLQPHRQRDLQAVDRPAVCRQPAPAHRGARRCRALPNPPDRALVLCVDENQSQIRPWHEQGRSIRTQPLLPMVARQSRAAQPR